MQVLRRTVPVLFLAVLGLALVASPALAGNGKIAGTISDEAGQTLVGASVSTDVGGVRVGTTTDHTGRYFILNVPPGTYAVQASYIGHQTVRKTEVTVRLDLTTSLGFTLRTEAIQGRTVTVVAEAPPIERSRTTSRSTISASEFDNTMPVSDLQDLINTTPSVFRGYIRGGRKADTKILVDGIDVSDSFFRAGEGNQAWSPYTDVSRTSANEYGSVGVNSSVVQELDIITGTFNAEYDAASAGIVNVVTREGGDEFHGRLFFRQGVGGAKASGPDVYRSVADTTTSLQYPSGRSWFALYQNAGAALDTSDDQVDKDKAARYYTFNPSQVTYGDAGATELEFSLGGPVLQNTNFYFTTRYSNDEGTLPNMLERSMRHTLKLTHRATNNMKITANLMIDDGGQIGGWVNRTFSSRYAFYRPGGAGNKKLGTMAYIGLNHVLSNNSFYEVKISRVTRQSEFGYSDDNGDGIVNPDEDGDFIIIDSQAEGEKYLGVDGSGANANGNFTFFNANPGNSKNFDLPFGQNQYRLAQPGFYYEDLQRDVVQLKADYTNQINYNHQLKTGILYRVHSVSQLMQRNQITVNYSNFPMEVSQWERSPTELAWYLQDRIEYGGVIVNMGLRVDGLDVDSETLEDPFHPSVLGEHTYGTGEVQVIRTPIRSGAVDTKWFVQPRLGVSHPISENAAMHYSWGKFYSPPSFSNLYQDYGSFTNPAWPTYYDPDANPTTATAYEMGLQYSFRPGYLLDVTAYYRDIENYNRLGLTISPEGAGFANYTYNTTGGYADSRGLELGLERRSNTGVTVRANYAFSYIKASANGNSATPFPNQTSFTFKSESDVESLQTTLDSKEQFNTYEQNVNGGGNPLVSGYDRSHRIGLTLQATLPAEVDLSVISTAESGFNYRVTATTEDPRARESDVAPWNLRTDVRASRVFAMGVGAFLEVRNLLGRDNILTYDNRNIPSRTIWEESNGQNPEGDLKRAFTQEGLPIYDTPRMVNVGLSVDF